jgi:hypothetical protein
VPAAGFNFWVPARAVGLGIFTAASNHRRGGGEWVRSDSGGRPRWAGANSRPRLQGLRQRYAGLRASPTLGGHEGAAPR